MLEKNRIYNLNCIDGLKQVDDNSIDLIVTSPPYNIGIEYDSYDDNKPWNEYYDWCRIWLKECFRVLKTDGRFALNHYLSLGTSGNRQTPIMDLNHICVNEIGFKHHSVGVWSDITLAKKTAWGSYLSASSPYLNCPQECILFLYKQDWKKQNKGISDIEKDDFVKLTRGRWDIKTETRGLTKANFSLDFAKKIITLLSYQGDLVLDPFMGSGTVAVSCIHNKRNYIGFELSKNYCEIAKRRIEEILL